MSFDCAFCNECMNKGGVAEVKSVHEGLNLFRNPKLRVFFLNLKIFLTYHFVTS